MTTIKVLFYAINGEGLGHLMRLHTIAEEICKLSRILGVRAHIQFLTTSDAPQAASAFPVFKIPSKRSVRNMGGKHRDYVAAAKLVISNVVASFQPDLLILDTQPQGAFREFLFLREFARRTMFIDRHKSDNHVSSRLNQSHLKLYDRILKPVERGDELQNSNVEELAGRTKLVGRIVRFNRLAAWTRDRVRSYFNVQPHEKLIYISAGGGGSRYAQEQNNELTKLASRVENVRFLVGYGPLFAGEKQYRDRLIPLTDFNASQYFLGLDAAVCAAGYNTYEELLAARIPSLFFAQPKGLDRQDLRIQHGLNHGWHGEIAGPGAENAASSLQNILDDSDPFPALETRPTSFGAVRAAAEIIDLAAAGDDAPQPSRLHLATAWRIAADKPTFIRDASIALRWLELSLSEAQWSELDFSATLAIERQEFDARFEWTEAVLATAGSLAAEFSKAEISSVDIDRALRKARLSLMSAINQGNCLESVSCKTLSLPKRPN